jgi:tetratricopeptide (TPR) repeat protein
MKRALILISLIVSFSLAKAQDLSGVPGLNYNSLERKYEKSNEEIADAKKSQKDKTWFDRGEILQDIHDVNTEFLRVGMPVSEAKLYLQEPNDMRTTEKDGVVTEEYVYDRITLIFQNGALKDWNETEVIHPDPLPEALKAYRKALELDEKGKMDDDVKEMLDRMKTQAENDAIRYFSRKEYDKALEQFELIQDISRTSVFQGYIDSVIIYNAALAARNAGNHEKSAQYFEKTADINYGGSDVYYLLKEEYISLKDSAKALDALERGYALYPDSTLLIFELINYHLSSGNSEEGMKYLEKAEQLAGDNPSIYFAKGTLFEKLGDDEKAMEAYKESLKIDPEFFNSWFNIGALYFNNAVEMYEKANQIEDLDEYNKAKNEADEVLKLSVEPLEKAHSINPEDRSCLETLKTIYYRLQMTEEMEAVQAKLDAL